MEPKCPWRWSGTAALGRVRPLAARPKRQIRTTSASCRRRWRSSCAGRGHGSPRRPLSPVREKSRGCGRRLAKFCRVRSNREGMRLPARSQAKSFGSKPSTLSLLQNGRRNARRPPDLTGCQLLDFPKATAEARLQGAGSRPSRNRWRGAGRRPEGKPTIFLTGLQICSMFVLLRPEGKTTCCPPPPKPVRPPPRAADRSCARARAAWRRSRRKARSPSSRGAIGRRRTPVLADGLWRRGDPESRPSPSSPGSLAMTTSRRGEPLPRDATAAF